MRTLVMLLCCTLLMAVAVHAAEPEWDLVLCLTGETKGKLLPVTRKVQRGGAFIDMDMGGYARLAAALKQVRRRYPGRTLTLSTGDDMAGPFYRHLGGGAIFRAMNQLGFDAATGGNRAFDHGDAPLATALGEAAFPVVVANVEPAPESPLHNVLASSTVLEINGLTVGVFGLVDKDLALISKPGPHLRVVKDFVQVAQYMTFHMRSLGCQVVVCLSHMPHADSRKVLREEPDLDVLVMADTDNLTKPGLELIGTPTGRPTAMVAAGQDGEALGLLKLKVENGVVVATDWEVILLDDTVTPDPEVAAFIDYLREELPGDHQVTISSVRISTLKPYIRTKEAAVGNLVCDILRGHFGADLCLYNTGGLQGDKVINPGPIMASDLDTLMPFGNAAHILRVTGAQVRAALEHGVSQLPAAHGMFMQVGGLRYTVDPSRPAMTMDLDDSGRPVAVREPGSRVVRVEVKTPTGYAPLNDRAEYTLVTSSFIARGGDGFIMFKDALQDLDTDIEVKEVVARALAGQQRIAPAVEGRITILGR